MFKRIHILTFVALLAGALIGTPGVQAQTTWYVDCNNCPGPGSGTLKDPFCKIQDGIDAADPNDTVLVLDGTYTGTGNKDLDFHGKAITVCSGKGPDNCIIDCQDGGRGFYFHWGEDADSVVDGFTITRGSVAGGGVYCWGSSPTVTNCTISASTGSDGGGVYCANGSHATISGCTITGNTVAYFGGGVYCGYGSDATITNCTITGNRANGYYGGGVYWWDSSPTITNCTITGNTAYDGGGVFCQWGSPTIITNCTIAGNSATHGGGVGCDASSPTITNCTVAGNTAGTNGGGVFVGSSSPTMTNCTIAANSANGQGGAIYCTSSTPTVINSILWSDTPQEIYVESGNVAVRYSDVQGAWPGCGNINEAPNFPDIPSGSGTWTADGVYNPMSYSSGIAETYQITFTDANAGWSENELAGKLVNPDTTQALQFVIVANTSTTITVWADWATIDTGASWVANGMDYQVYDYHLTGVSPCIDAGCNCGVPPDIADLDNDDDTEEPTPLDLDGEGRFFDDPSTDDTGSGCPPIVDMGAYEFGGTGPQPCCGDLDCDRDIDLSDLAALLANYGITSGMTYTDGDLDCDCDVDLADLAKLLSRYGTTCP